MHTFSNIYAHTHTTRAHKYSNTPYAHSKHIIYNTHITCAHTNTFKIMYAYSYILTHYMHTNTLKTHYRQIYTYTTICAHSTHHCANKVTNNRRKGTNLSL